jgi:hypothetical protein
MHRQRGELSLVWAAVLAAALAFGAMAALFAMRYQRNLFAEAWNGMLQTSAVQALQKSRTAAENTLKPESAAMRKCMLGGKTVYSNVECSASNPTSSNVELNDSHGIEPHRATPVASTDGNAPADIKSRMIESSTPR